jgi:hypothetical protein
VILVGERQSKATIHVVWEHFVFDVAILQFGQDFSLFLVHSFSQYLSLHKKLPAERDSFISLQRLTGISFKPHPRHCGGGAN